MEFSRQEYWSGLPFHSPGDLPNPGIKPASHTSPALADRFLMTPRGTLECNPEIPVAPGEKNSVLDTSLDELYFALLEDPAVMYVRECFAYVLL